MAREPHGLIYRGLVIGDRMPRVFCVGATRWRNDSGRFSGLVATAVLSAALSCGKPPAATSPGATVIRIAHESDVLSLDPAAFLEAVTTSVLANLYEGLVAFDKDMRLVPALAVSWSVIDDRTWLINLRQGVRFHDGRVLTAADVKFSLARVQADPASGLKGQISTVEEVEVVSEAAVRLRTLRPDPLLLNRLAYILILPRGRPSEDYLTRPIGTGPYRFVRWDRGKLLEVAAFADYWGGKAPFDRALFLPIENGESALRALKQGEVDVLRWVPETMMSDFRAVPGIRIETRPGIASYFLWFHSTHAKGAPRSPFEDRRVRQAISLAIDRREIVKALGGNGTPSNQLVVKGVFGYVSSLPELPFDPEGARRLLKEAGYNGGFETTLVHRPGTSVTAVCELVGRMLGAVGIRVRLEMQDWPSVVARWTQGRLPFFFAAWRFDDGDALSFLRDCLSTRDPSRNYGSFNPGFSSPTLDRLIDENGRILREVDRLQHYEKVMQTAMEEMPLVPLYDRYNLFAVSDRVRWQPRLEGNLLAAEMSLK